MALYPQMNVTVGGLANRTHTSLVRSEGMSPAEKWILDPDLPGLFEYRFGGFGNVVIPKGTIVAVTEPKYDWETEKVVNCLTIATGSNTPIGVAPYNFYEKKRDRMGDNQLSIINREYIEVPFVTGADAANMQWGCATGALSTSLLAGDFVKPNSKGQFVKWNVNAVVVENLGAVGLAAGQTVYLSQPIKASAVGDIVVSKCATETGTYTALTKTTHYTAYGNGVITIVAAAVADGDYIKVSYISGLSDPIEQRVGQILAVETDLPPLGWLAYFLNMDAQENELNNGIRQSSYPPGTAGAYPGTADFAALVKQAFGPGAANAKGIKFLTDGYFRAKVVHGTTDTPVVLDTVLPAAGYVVGASANCSIADTTSVITTTEAVKDGQIVLQFANPIAQDEPVHVYFNAVEVKEGVKYHIDYYTNRITLYVAYADNTKPVTIACTTIENQVPGIPTEWDYKGSVGAVRILLSK